MILTKKRREDMTGKELTSQQLFDVYKGNMEYSASSEPCSKHFIDYSITLYDKVLKFPELADVVYRMDAELGEQSPWAWVQNLHVVVHLARTSEHITWVIHSIADLLDSGLLRPGDIHSASVLNGARTGGKGLVHLLMLKQDTKVYLLTEWAEKHGIDAQSRIEAMVNQPAKSGGVWDMYPLGGCL